MSAKTAGASFGAAAASAKSHPNRQQTPRASETVSERKVRLIEKAEAHFEKHRDRWVASRYQTLLRKDAPAPSLKPPGTIEDRTSRLMRTAAHLADRKQAGRIRMIEGASFQKLRSGMKSDFGR